MAISVRSSLGRYLAFFLGFFVATAHASAEDLNILQGAVGLLASDGKHPHCHAERIGPRMVLTASHCVLSVGPGGVRDNWPLSFRSWSDLMANLPGNPGISHHDNGPPVSPFDPHDWSVIQLRDESQSSFLEVYLGPVKPGMAILMPRIELSEPYSVKIYSCHFTGIFENGLFSHDCPTEPGVSGAPILVSDPQSGNQTGELFLLGVHHSVRFSDNTRFGTLARNITLQ